MAYSCIDLTSADGIATLTFNRPKALNALNSALLAELADAIGQIGADESLRVLILTGAGEKSFIAGADITEIATLSPLGAKQFARFGQEVISSLQALPIPVIAAVNGFALGGGCEMALACDFIYASEKALFGLPEITLGLIPGYGGTQRLARLVGKGKAMEMIFTAGMIKADEALQWGLVNHVVPPDQRRAKCNELAAAIMKNSPSALASAIRAVNAGHEPGADGMQREIEEFGKCFGTADFREGTTAFMAKRKAVFTGG